MNLRRTFNRHQQQFVYFFTVFFLGLIVMFYIWTISVITVAISASLQNSNAAPAPQNFKLTDAEKIPFLNPTANP